MSQSVAGDRDAFGDGESRQVVGLLVRAAVTDADARSSAVNQKGLIKG
jgi:hypothetical protein